MRAIVMFIALLLPIGLIMSLDTSNAASNGPTSAGQVTFVPIDRTHVLLALPPKPTANAPQRKSGAKTFVSPSSGAGEHPPMPIYPPSGTAR